MGLHNAPTDSDELLAEAYPWPKGQSWTRVTMLRALDGGVAGADKRSRSLSGDVDREILREVRRLCDAIVVGATTMRLEPYGPVQARPEAVEQRRGLGLADAPVLVLVSGSLDLPWDEPVFTESACTPIAVTTDRASEHAQRRAAEHVEVIRLPGERVSAEALVAALQDRGLRRLVCEGGPGLLASFAAEDQVQEVDLTVSPYLQTLGPGSTPAWAADPQHFELSQVLEHESMLFARYLRTPPDHH